MYIHVHVYVLWIHSSTWFHVNIFRNKLKTSPDIKCCKSLSGGRPKNHPVMEAAEKEVQDRTILFRNVRIDTDNTKVLCIHILNSMYYRLQDNIYKVWYTMNVMCLWVLDFSRLKILDILLLFFLSVSTSTNFLLFELYKIVTSYLLTFKGQVQIDNDC